MTSRRLGAVATAYGVADSGTVLFLESDFRSMTSRRLVVVATTYGVADSGPFWCVAGGRVPRCFTVIY